MCHLPLGTNSALNSLECGAGGSCTLAAGTTCPVEIPLTDAATPFAERSEIVGPIWAKNPSGIGGVLDLLSTTAFALSGSSSDDPADQCLPNFIRTVPSQGVRYLLPASRGGDGTKTFIRWNEDPTGLSALYRHNDDGVVCCNSTVFLCLNQNLGPFQQYPLLNYNSCKISSNNNPGIALFLQTPDWIFDGGAGTFFQMDPEFAVPGQVAGVCRVNRDRGCTTLPQPPTGTHALGIDCASLGDIDPNTPGVQLDTCDMREPGIRTTRPGILANNYPITDRCANSHYVLRGTPEVNCHITERYLEDGDPGPDCDVVNFGVRTRPDFDCDGVADSPDLCPLLNEFDHLADSDEDCDISPARCRGDECECGDQNLDGSVSVTDLTAINLAIFQGPQFAQELCDTNLDDRCNVSDILGANQEIFVPGSAVCSHVTTINCGDGFLDPSEECDDGNRFAGDGCNPVCICEPGSPLPDCN
jgi:cysteine-rich repeat protein